MGDFDGSPEGGTFSGPLFWNAPSFEIKLDGFTQVGARAFDIFALGGYVEFGATRDVPSVFLGDECGEAVSHKLMLAEVR
jgi:hypothetical protein